MAKKWKVGLSVLITCLILVLIPIGVIAATNINQKTSNRVSFRVTDFEGTFYAKFQDETTTNPTLAHVFTSAFNNAQNDYVITKGNGVTEESGVITYTMPAVTFNFDNTKVTYTLAFVNSGSNAVAIDFESDSDVEAEFKNAKAKTSIQYEVLTVANSSIEALPEFTNSAVNLAEDTKQFNNVTIPGSNGVTYSVIVINYVLEVTPEVTKSFNTNIDLSLNLTTIV